MKSTNLIYNKKFNFILTFTIQENYRHKCYYLLCLYASFLVTLVCLVSKNIVTQGSIIFLMLGERESGEMDIILSTKYRQRNNKKTMIEDNYIDYSFINYTNFGEIMEKKYSIKNNNKKNINNPFETSTYRNHFVGFIKNEYDKNVHLIVINSTKEKEMGLGRNWPFEKMNQNECIVNQKYLKSINKKTNKLEIIIILDKFVINTLLMNYYKDENQFNPNLNNLSKLNFQFTVSCKVVGNFSDNYGKYKGDYEKLMFMESEYFYKGLYEQFERYDEYFPNYSKWVKDTNPAFYGNELIINFSKNRINYYIESDYNKLLQNGVNYANELIEEMNNLEYINIDMPLISNMQKFNYGLVLLNLILNVIIISLFILSLILIYSLLLITTETNSFEFGILRLVGTTKRDIIIIVIVKCLLFSIPAFIIAFLVQFKIINLINSGIKSIIKTDLSLSFNYDSLYASIMVNFLSPIIASIIPIRNILKKNIGNSLNSMINKTSGMQIQIMSVEKKEKNNLILFGIIMFFYGASIYYFLPLSLISFNFGMLGSIFLFILFGILLGFVVISMNIENIFQKILTYIIFFFSKNFIKQLIIKNLTAHRLKNRKTSIMYTLSVGIFIMIGVGLDLIVESQKREKIMYMGNEIIMFAYYNPLYPWQLQKSLITLIQEGAIETFSFKSQTLEDLCYGNTASIDNLGKSLSFNIYLKGLNPSYFETINPEDVSINKQNKKYKNFSPIEQLYFKENFAKTGMSAIFNWEFNADLNTEFFLKISNTKTDMRFISQPYILFDAVGGLNMNSQPSNYQQRTNIISVPLFLDLINKCSNFFSDEVRKMNFYSYENFPIEQVFLKPNKKNYQDSIEKIINVIGNDLYFDVYLYLFQKRIDKIETIEKIIFNIYHIVISIILFFCFFNITASMTINIFEQKKEIAILRSLGMNQKQIIYIYVCEAIILIFSSSIIGIIIGSFISYTMSLQWQMFTYINIAYNLKLQSLIMIILFSILGGILSTIVPAKNMLKIPISQLIKEI